MRGADFAAERRTSQNEFPAAKTDEVGEVGVAAGKLFDRHFASAGEALLQKRLQTGAVSYTHLDVYKRQGSFE